MDSARLAGQAERTAALVITMKIRVWDTCLHGETRHFHPLWWPLGTGRIPVKTGIQEALPKTALPRQGECGRYQRVIRPTCHCGGACPRGGGGPQSRERELETGCLLMLDARLMGRFPLMQLAWIPACAAMT